MEIDQIIDALGGARQIQTLLGVGPSAVSNYRSRGQFPEHAKLRIWQALKARGITADPETLDISPKPARTGTGTHASDAPVVLLIMSGGIAAYKVLEVIRRLRDGGKKVRVIMTKAATAFVTPLSVAALAQDTVRHDLFSLNDESEMDHIQLAREADAVLVAPATANIMARMAAGLADDLATTALLATGAPILIAPAMNPFMWAHPATQSNLRLLKRRGIRFVGPDSGDTACGEDGVGRLAEPAAITAALEHILPGNGLLDGKTALVTSGPTHEPIDRVRYIANRSSGKQGHAIAAALARQGATVTLISGPVDEPPPQGVRYMAIETASEMLTAALAAMPVDIAVCAAAVADWSVADTGIGKIKKQDGAVPPLALVENPDILQTIGHHPMRPELVVGFAAETEDLLTHAAAKRQKKGADWIVANDVGQNDAPVFGSDDNQVWLITAGSSEAWPRMSKQDIANALVSRMSEELRT